MTPLAVLLAAAVAAQQQPATFAVGVEAVYVDVFVRDASGPLRDLSAADFRLSDNGVPQSVELVATESLPLTTLLLLDSSDSVSGVKLQQLQIASRALLRQTPPGDQVGLVTFGHEVRYDVPPTTDMERLEKAVAGLRPAGSTALVDALYAATVLMAHSRALVFLFTDGEDNMSVLRVPELVRMLERSDVLLQAVGIVPESRPEWVDAAREQTSQAPFSAPADGPQTRQGGVRARSGAAQDGGVDRRAFLDRLGARNAGPGVPRHQRGDAHAVRAPIRAARCRPRGPSCSGRHARTQKRERPSPQGLLRRALAEAVA